MKVVTEPDLQQVFKDIKNDAKIDHTIIELQQQHELLFEDIQHLLREIGVGSVAKCMRELVAPLLLLLGMPGIAWQQEFNPGNITDAALQVLSNKLEHSNQLLVYFINFIVFDLCGVVQARGVLDRFMVQLVYVLDYLDSKQQRRDKVKRAVAGRQGNVFPLFGSQT